MYASLEQWALPRLQQLLPLDDESLKQVLQYANSLPKDASAEHLKDLLGDDPKSLEFISSFNMRRQKTPASSTMSSSSAADHHASPDVPGAAKSHQKKKKPHIHALPARQIEDRGNVSGAYQKRAEEDYMPAGLTHHDQVAEKLALRQKPDATQLPLITDQATSTARPITSKAPPSASGSLVSDSLSAKKGASSKASAQSSRTSSPAPKARVNLSGGTAMHGASTALSDLDSAIRSLELQTNPSLSVTSGAGNEKRKCNCMATRHQLLDMAPNCLQCGKIICVKEGLGPCTFCGSSLLSAEDIHKVLRVLKDERGEERMNANNVSHKRAEVSQGKARAYTGRDFLTNASSARSSPFSSQPATPAESDDEATEKAKAHRDKLLGFQANNARRTQIHDEAADFDVPVAGTNVWASPHERAQQLKKQQRVLREMEWNAKPEYEKRRVVASIDLKGGRVVRRMADLEKPDFEVSEEAESHENAETTPSTTEGGAFSHNPLASGLIRPTAREAKGKEVMRENKRTWRRVQMDEDDNEQWILDGGLYGEEINRSLGNEPARG